MVRLGVVTVLLAAALLLALPGAAGTATAPPSPQNGTSVLDVGANPQSDFVSPNASVMGALTMDRATVQGSFLEATLAHRLQNASTDAARTRVLTNATAVAAVRVQAIRDDEATARNAFLAGRLTANAYASRLAELDARATALDRLLDAIQGRARSSSVITTAKGLQADLRPFQGSLQEALASAVRGNGARVRVHLAATDHGLSLSRIAGGDFVRFAYRADHRTATVNESWSFADVYPDGPARYYPWAMNHTRGINMRLLGRDAYTVEIPYRNGTTNGVVRATIDPSNRAVFTEFQSVGIPGAPTGPAVSATRGNVTLVVNRTYAGGPLRVRVVNATGDPLDATVRVGNLSLGQIGPDGAAWTLSPGGAFTVTAQYGDTAIVMNVSATDDPSRAG